MRAWMIAVTLVAIAAPAFANDTCRELPAPKKYVDLPDAARVRFNAGQQWENRKAKDWPNTIVHVYLKVAPHLAGDILSGCASGIKIDRADPADRRRLTAHVTLHVSSYAALARFAQLPMVTSLQVYSNVSFDRRRMRPQLDIDF